MIEKVEMDISGISTLSVQLFLDCCDLGDEQSRGNEKSSFEM